MRHDRPSAPPRSRRAGLAAALAGLLALLFTLGGCAGELATKGEALRLLGGNLARGVVFEPYAATLNAVGGLRPYTFTLLTGSLPPGLVLDNGAIRGAPTEPGTFEVTVQVSDANLSRVSQSFTLQVVKAPEPRFVLDAPLTEVRSEVTLRARLEDARGVTGVRGLVTWDAERFALAETGPEAGGRGLGLVWQAAAGSLQVDVVGLGKELTGSPELFRFTLRPLTPPARVQATYTVEVVSSSADPDRRHDYLTGSVGGAPNPAVPAVETAPDVEPAPPHTEDEDAP